MHYQISFETMPGYVQITTNGNPSFDRFSKLLTELTDAPEWVIGTPQLVDHRNLDFSNLSQGDIDRIRTLINFFASKIGSGKVAFVMQGTLGLLAAENYCHPEKIPHLETAIFTDIEQAKDWICS